MPQYRTQPCTTMHSGIIVLALVASVAASPILNGQHQQAADQDLLNKQQDIIYLFEQMHQDLPNQELYNIGNTYDIESNIQQYHEPNTVAYYAGMVKAGLVQPQGTVYSNSVSQLRKEVALLSRVLLSAKDYPVFLKTAAWARVHVNEGQYVKALISVILQREDLQGVIPPPLWEIYPEQYLDARVIQEAQYIQAQAQQSGQVGTIVIQSNYTDYLPHGEHKLAYYTGDVNLNSYYAYVALAGYMIPEQEQQHGVNTQQHGVNTNGRGSQYWYLHQQLHAHYNLHRLSAGLGPIDNIDIEKVQAPFQPHLRYPNGLEFPGRDNEVHLTNVHQDLIKNVYALEKRILNAIDSGYVLTPQHQFLSIYEPQGLNILGELIEGTGRSVNPRYYGSLQAAARQLIGNAPSYNNIWSYSPSALELSETAARDPAFYQLWKRILKLFQRYQESLPAYQYNDLVYPGVKIQEVAFDQLVTYFEQQHIQLGGIGGLNHDQNKLNVVAGVSQLNHKPYNYKIVVQNENAPTNVAVRVYLGPKYNYDGKTIDITHNRHLFVELDQFVHQLQGGENVIIRNSIQAPHLGAQWPSVHHLQKDIVGALSSQNPHYITKPQQIFGYPMSLALPKGTEGGLPLQVFVIVSPLEQQQSVAWGPVVPEEWQTYQQHQLQILASDQYTPSAESTVAGAHGVYKTIEVIPEYQGVGVYGNELAKQQAYYGHYLYHKYPQYQYIGQTGMLGTYHHQGIGQVHSVHQGQYQTYGQQGSMLQGQTQQGSIVQGQAQQGSILQGQAQQGSILHGQVYQGQVPIVGGVGHVNYGQTHQGQLYQGLNQASVGSGNVQVPYQKYGLGGQQQLHGINSGNVQYDPLMTNVQKGLYQSPYVSGQQGNSVVENQYWNGKHISQIIGGAISYDNKPYGYPLERPISSSVYYVPNIKIVDVLVHHVDVY